MDNEIKMRMMELRMKNYCCAQIIMQLGLEKMEKENPELVSAVAGLCEGMKLGGTCGTLSSAICLLYLADPKAASDFAVEELTDWFYDSYGATEHDELMGDNPLQVKVEECPGRVESTFEKVCDLLDWD